MKRRDGSRARDLLRKAFLRLAFCAATLAAAAMAGVAMPPAALGGPVAQFNRTGAVRHFHSGPGVSAQDFVARVGASPFDRIGLHRIAPPRGHTPLAVLLYLPGTNMNGLIPVDDPRYSLPLYLAVHGVEVWTFDYRTHFVPATAAKPELAQMRGWTNDVFASDINSAADFVRAATHRHRVFVAGFSRGVEFAYLFAAMHPGKVRGLVILDGFIPSRPSSEPPAGRYADDVSGRHLTFAKRQALMEAVIKNPNGPAPLPRYRTAAENLEHVVYGAGGIFGGHGGLANPLGGYSDPATLARVLVLYDRYWPAVQDYENPFNPALLASLGRSHVPVIAFASTNFGHGWPAKVAESAHSTDSADVRVTILKNWGHLDVIHGTHAQARVYAPVLAFITQRRK